NASNLSEVQLNYAANDVLYLISIQQKLMVMLKREGRWKLAQSCFDCIPIFVDLDIGQYRNIFEH
ncbi:MAG: ribonuclease D, partial [cyanobacterium endosymbiont of Rhopalodia fuxianensis]